MKQTVQKPETTAFIKHATLTCHTAGFQPLRRMEHFLPAVQHKKINIMNADYFWLIMGAMLIIAIIIQVATDKRRHRKHRRKQQ